MEISKRIGNVQVAHLDESKGSDTISCHHGNNHSVDGSFEGSV